jgi:membrane fusion protein (multidrug efflux system)
MKSKRTVTVVAIVGLAAAVVAAYLLQRPASNPTSDQIGATAKSEVKSDAKAAKGAAPAPVEVVELVPQRVVEELNAVGTLRAHQSVILRPEVTGRVASIGFRDGQHVRKGQLLIGLDAALLEAEAAQVRAELELAQANLRRTADLARQNFVSSSAQESAESNVTVLAARLQLAQARLDRMRIVAPFDGVVGLRAVSIGDVVKDGTDLVNLEDVSRLKVDFRLPERLFARLLVGQPIEVTADAVPGAVHRGRVDAINPRIDPGGRSLEVRAELPNPRGSLRPGMFVRVRVIAGDRAEALLAPEAAVVPQGDQFFVFRVVDGRAQRVPVTLGVRREGQVELISDLRAGDRIVTAGMRVQRDGQPVRVLAEAAGAAPQAPTAQSQTDGGSVK